MNSVGTIFDSLLFSKREPHVVIGRVKGSLFKKEKLTESELNHHVHVVGASGFGKTVLLSHIVRQRIEQGKGLLFLDLKGDLDTIEKFRSFARVANRSADIQILSLAHQDISTGYNVVGSGSATQIRDRIMLSLNWSEEFYRNQSASFLLKLLIGLCWLRDHKDEVLTLATILEALSSQDFIEELCLKIPQAQCAVRKPMEEIAVSCKSSDYWNSLQGLRTQIESVVLSDFGTLLTKTNEGIDLFDAATSSKLVFMFLDTRRYGETAKLIGRFILQDLKAVSAKVDSEVQKSNRRPFSVIIDEFSDLAQEDFIAFLDRARSSRFSVIVAHQEICDLQRISPEFAGRLMGNTATVYAFLQKRGESAELLAGIAGTRTVKRKTERHTRQMLFEFPTGETSVREVEEFWVHPNKIKSLPVGRCVCIKKYPIARSYQVNVSAD